jgi:hypothetical protein
LPANAWAVGQFGAVGGDNAFAVRYCTPAPWVKRTEQSDLPG